MTITNFQSACANVRVLFKSYSWLCCFHLGWGHIPLSVSSKSLRHSQRKRMPFLPTGQKGESLSTLKAFSHGRTNPQLRCHDQGHFWSNNKVRDDVVNRFPPGQRGTFHLGSAGWRKLTWGFSLHDFMVREVRAEHADITLRCEETV